MDAIILIPFIFMILFLMVIVKMLKKQRDEAVERLKSQLESNAILFKQKKSSEVKLGNISEKLAPFLDNFPCGAQDAHFMGQPIDYIAFDDEGVHFVEVKSGDARLSPKQKTIRDQIQAGKIHWHVMRIK